MLIEKVQDKLDEYGLTIYSDYELEEEKDQHLFITKHAVIFVRNKDENIGISFQVVTKPERAATLTLIIREIGYPVYIMESFIFDQNQQFVSGEAAYELIQNVNKKTVLNQFKKEQTYKEYLRNVEGYSC